MALVVRSQSVAQGAGSTPDPRGNRLGEMVVTPYLLQLVLDDRVYCVNDTAEDATITGRTSFAATTPDLLIDVPAGRTVIPLWLHLAQSGTVAGGDITVVVTGDNIDRYGSGGTSESVANMRNGGAGATSLVYSSSTTAITANAAGTERILYAAVVPAIAGTGTQDQTQDIHLFAFENFMPPVLVGPAGFLVFTYAATTGPTFQWSLGFAEFSSADLGY